MLRSEARGSLGMTKIARSERSSQGCAATRAARHIRATVTLFPTSSLLKRRLASNLPCAACGFDVKSPGSGKTATVRARPSASFAVLPRVPRLTEKTQRWKVRSKPSKFGGARRAATRRPTKPPAEACLPPRRVNLHKILSTNAAFCLPGFGGFGRQKASFSGDTPSALGRLLEYQLARAT